jgi:hypothetical protein
VDEILEPQKIGTQSAVVADAVLLIPGSKKNPPVLTTTPSPVLRDIILQQIEKESARREHGE